MVRTGAWVRPDFGEPARLASARAVWRPPEELLAGEEDAEDELDDDEPDGDEFDDDHDFALGS